uniref:Epithelial stromal interaction 1 n=1 Tax=Nannospalax galili TaxID=1026970 RepID=A0A8C6RQ43_NANGA
RLRTSSVSTRDPQSKELGRLQTWRQGLEVEAPKDPTPENPGSAAQRSTGTYTLIAPNENRRQQIQRIAEQELANLEEWKKQNRAKPVHLVPRQLGGSQSESEVRQKQQLQLMRSKYQQKRAESIQIRKEAEEAELQRMKAIQREKSNKLEKKKRLQENLRREAFREHHQYLPSNMLTELLMSFMGTSERHLRATVLPYPYGRLKSNLEFYNLGKVTAKSSYS